MTHRDHLKLRKINGRLHELKSGHIAAVSPYIAIY